LASAARPAPQAASFSSTRSRPGPGGRCLAALSIRPRPSQPPSTCLRRSAQALTKDVAAAAVHKAVAPLPEKPRIKASETSAPAVVAPAFMA
jgi:hypothetical protein